MCTLDQFDIGDSVCLKQPYRGYYAAEVVGFEGCRIIIEFSSGLQIRVYDDELERN